MVRGLKAVVIGIVRPLVARITMASSQMEERWLMRPIRAPRAGWHCHGE